MANDRSWLAKAACRGKPTNIFFVERGQSTREARKICESCVVREECLEEILTADVENDLFGVFGGLSPRERRKIRAERAREKKENSKTI